MSGENKKMSLKRHFISMETKLQILDRLKKGEKISYVAKSLDLNEATIRTIRKNGQKIRDFVAAGCTISSNMTSRPRAAIIEQMEKALSIWIEDCSKKRIPLSTNIIKHKALKIYDYLKENGETATNPDFVASKGWFDRMRKRLSLQNLKIEGESASADKEAAEIYPIELKRIIEDGGYSTHQVFNADETAHWWKKMPKRTYISKDEKVAPGFKVSKDRVTLLMCSNASGDHMVKPMLVYKSLNPRAMKNLNKSNLPVYWAANKKAWVTTELFKKWFSNCFVPSVENYLKQKNLDFKVLLILDNAPSHPQDLNNPNIKIIFLPPNTTALLQPLDQGIIATFKTNYIRRSMQWVLNKTDDESMDVKEAWKLFTILDCINLINSSIREIKPTTLNGCWKKIWPESIESENLIETAENRMDAVVEVAKSLGGEGFDDMTAQDIQELLVEEEIDEAGLVEMISGIHDNSEDDSIGEDEEVKKFTLQSIKKGLGLAEQLESYFLNEDPSNERSTKFKRELHKCLAPYKEIYKDLLTKSKQSKITDFLQKVEHGSEDNAEKCSEDEDILPKRKRPRLIVLSDDEENIV